MNKDQNLLIQALRDCRSAFIVTFLFSFAVNILNLITPLYSLQVLDRVLGSYNHYTLLMLTVIIVFVYLSYTLIQMARSFTLIKIGEWLDVRLSPKLFSHAVANSAIQPSMGASQIIREFGTIKTFLTSVGINSLFDAPWSVIYIIVVFMIHPYLGWVTVVGALLMLFMAFLNAYSINSTLSSSGEYNLKSHYLAEIANRNAETVQAMGMMKDVQSHWSKMNTQALYLQSIASYRNGIISNATRFFRSILQVAVTGIGAYIVITTGGKDMTAGNMIASSIIVGRALAPFDQAVEVWKQVQSALKSYKKIKDSLDKDAARPDGIGIANPDGKVTAENIFFVPNSSQRDRAVYTLRGISFALEAGKSLAIIGPSASGKSTLARIIAGVWKPAMGNMHLDGLDVYNWKREEFGKHVGYLSQNIELFNGSVKDNIARMSENPDSEKIIEAARLAGAHEMISALPKGYETDIGLGGSMLSGGQKQRVGIARAFYGSPKLIVLDEPNANLDDKGEKALVDALANAKRSKITTILISHRPSILAFVDMILVLQDGMVAAFGPRDEIMARASKAMQNTQQQKQ